MTRKERLERLRRSLVTRRNELRGMLANDETRNDSSGDEGDVATSNSMAELGTMLAAHHSEEIVAIETAVKKFQLGRYGICEMTGAPIPIARLEALPFTRYSVEAQRMIEEQGLTEEEIAAERDWSAIDRNAAGDREVSLRDLEVE
ncbi:TraR/DksA family transcriptional regulator [Stratiformator vulcanicus]|uniref:General stress protein 16O n=1 Tax=Stratiformator vulcanicus TaxID=2527980 RepID=A0A517R4I8_9PLAN|nr:TraR/DksA C4-type zinc finger protein [Stratiformator vulcanicus]QDT38786.1 General stress protein 16O [Stratiformator vulcanicus]